MSFKEKFGRVVAQVRADTRTISGKIGKAAHGINKISKKQKKFANKRVLKEGKQVTIAENQPVYTEDRSRFFKQAWHEDRRQLYFK